VATRKQRARRAKGKRHDYEVVYLDSEGNEVEPDESEPSKGAKAPARATSSSKAPTATPSKSKSRLMREPQPPSWSRAAKRGGLFAALMVGVLVVTNRQQTPIGLVAVAIVFLGLVIPLGYYTDQFTWRGYQKRLAGKSAGKPTGKSPAKSAGKSTKR
jgi:hypothetical protein